MTSGALELRRTVVEHVGAAGALVDALVDAMFLPQSSTPARVAQFASLLQYTERFALSLLFLWRVEREREKCQTYRKQEYAWVLRLFTVHTAHETRPAVCALSPLCAVTCDVCEGCMCWLMGLMAGVWRLLKKSKE